MTLQQGARLGPYEILAPIGAGGMGEVYRAKDTRLDRQVAIKVLPERLSEDAEALARFEREAKAVAALSHPNIVAMLDVGTHEGAAYAVMELLEGETLRARLERGPLLGRKAVDCAVQIAHGLAAAHEKGIVHRDLKPENVFLTSDGHVKVLDFGLAKTAGPAGGPDSGLQTATRHTNPGTVMGTVGYMSPEQVRGEVVDHRSDIFSFGAVLYEMLTGRRAFGRETAADSMSAILKDDPPEIAASGSGPSSALQAIVQHCLEKKPRERFQSARDMVFALNALSSSSDSQSARAPIRPVRRWSLVVGPAGFVAVAALALLAVVITALYLRSVRKLEVEVSRVMRVAVVLPAGEQRKLGNAGRNFAISPDGMKLVYAVSRGVTAELRLRSLDAVDSAAIPGTEEARGPFFSPDGKWIAFSAGRKLKKVALAGGMPTSLCDTPAFRGGAWSDDGWIYFVPNLYTPVYRIPEAGGKPERVTQIRTADGEQQHRWPEVLPGGNAILYVVGSGGEWDDATIVAERLGTGQRSVLVKGGSSPRYLPTGHLVYSRAGSLYALKFDSRSLAVRGAPVEVARNVYMEGAGAAQMDFSRTGILLTLPVDSVVADLTLSWVDRTGDGEPLNAVRQPYSELAISPDGSRVASLQGNAIAVLDLARLTTVKLTLPARAEVPVWSGDGRRLFFGLEKRQHYEIFSKAADDSGTEQIAYASESSEFPLRISADGTRMLTRRSPPYGQAEMLLREVGGPASRTEPKLLFKSLFLDSHAAFSPDTHWAAYESQESGRPEVYIRPTSGEDRKWQVSTDGGSMSIWSPDGKEIFYLCGMKFMAAPVDASAGEPKIGTPKVLFENHEIFSYDVTRDGRRFLVAENPNPGASSHLDIVVNWFSEVARKLQESSAP